MTSFLKENTAQVVRFGPFVDETDGFTPETALTISQGDMRLSKDGGAFAQKNAAGNATHDADGWYSTTLDTTDTEDCGILIFQVNLTGALPVWHEYYVVSEAVYDALFAEGAAGYLMPTVAGRTLDVTATGAAGIDWSNVENPTATVDLSDTGIALCDVTTTNTDMRGTDSANTVIPPTVAQMNARTLLAAEYFDPGVDTVVNVTNVATVTTCVNNTDMRGTDSALLASTAPSNFSDLAITASTGRVDVDTNNDKTGYTISGTKTTLDALTDISASEVNNEILDVLTVDTFPESTSVPADTSSILDKLTWLFTLGRNKVTQTESTQTLRNNADSSDVGTASVSDDGTTFTRNKFS